MPRHLALAASLLLVWYLFSVDRKAEESSSTLWIPLAWMFFAGSRFLSQWIHAMTGIDTLRSEDGSPLDRVVFLLLIFGAVAVLHSRKIDWRRFFLNNLSIWLFFVFGFFSVLWSIDPGLSFKRLPKAIGNVLMAAVILTEKRPFDALGTILRRLAYLTLPLSVVFIKYFPQLGRGYHSSGIAMYNGVGTQKNSLGQLCLLAGLYCGWKLLYSREKPIKILNGLVRVEYVLIGLIVWLMTMANSATALTCLIVGVVIMSLGCVRGLASPRKLVSFTILGVLLVAVIEHTAGLSASVIKILGRRPDLTTRVPMWTDMLERSTGNRWLGVGFEAYWFTQAGVESYARWKVNTAHNGYLETFLSSGLIGLAILSCGLLISLLRIASHNPRDIRGAAMRLSLIFVVLLYNWTESTFRSISNTWLLVFLASINIVYASEPTQDNIVDSNRTSHGVTSRHRRTLPQVRPRPRARAIGRRSHPSRFYAKIVRTTSSTANSNSDHANHGAKY